MQIATPLPNIGTVIPTNRGSYKIGNRIDNNQGGFSWVYGAMEVKTLTPVVIKFFKPNNRHIEDVQKQWMKETGLFDRLRHTNIVSIYDAYTYGNLFFIVLERAWGDLKKHVLSQLSIKKLSENETKLIASQLISALSFIHKNGVIHKDLTIYNILVFKRFLSQNIFKISDFGISKELLSPIDVISTTQMIHPEFTPPEFLQDGFVDQQSDLYQLGLVLLYCIIGVNIFEGKNQQEINKMIADAIPRRTAESFKSPFCNFISILLRRHKEYRFQNVKDVQDHFYKL
jgi:serine/threonine protein kinase